MKSKAAVERERRHLRNGEPNMLSGSSPVAGSLMKTLMATLLIFVLALSGVLPVFAQNINHSPFTATEMQQLMTMGFEIATPADRAAAAAAGVEWRDVASFAEAIAIASGLRAAINAMESIVELSGPGDVPANLLATGQSSEVLTRKTKIVEYLTSYIEVGARATRTVTYDPVSGKVKYTWSNAADHWIGLYGLTLGWLENEETSVSYPYGYLQVDYSADIVTSIGPLVIRENISGFRSWRS